MFREITSSIRRIVRLEMGAIRPVAHPQRAAPAHVQPGVRSGTSFWSPLKIDASCAAQIGRPMTPNSGIDGESTSSA